MIVKTMGCCQSQKVVDKQKSNCGVIESSKMMKKTATGKHINRKVLNEFLTEHNFEVLVRKIRRTAFLFKGEYSDLTIVLDNLYVTGLGGLTQENLNDHRIKCIVNSTFEIPLYEIQGIITIRIPVDDDPNENISIYFDELCLQIEEWITDHMGVVVHCVCGVSRSVTIILAYLMKIKGKTLKEAFLFVKNKRNSIKPNYAFFGQLIDYEKRLFQRNTVHMISYVNKKGVSYQIPDLYLKLFPKLMEKEETILDATLVPFITQL